MDGLIGAKMVSIGELVGKGEPTLMAPCPPSIPSGSIARSARSNYLKAESEVRRTGRQVSELPVSLVLADGSVHPAQGKFVFIDRAWMPRPAPCASARSFQHPEAASTGNVSDASK
jgi:membrane fusion protein (multidrug efflux system)